MKGLRGLFESLGALLGESPESVEKKLTVDKSERPLRVAKAMLLKGETLDEFSSRLRQAIRDYAEGGDLGTRKDGDGVPVYLETAYEGWAIANNYKDQSFYRVDYARDSNGDFVISNPQIVERVVDWRPVQKWADFQKTEKAADTKQTETIVASGQGVRVVKDASGVLRVESDGQIKPVRILKRQSDRRVAVGVVADPYMIDGHGDIAKPDNVRDIAHEYLAFSRETKAQHMNSSGAVVVESFLFPYPSQADHDAAMAGQEHRIFKVLADGGEYHSGAWMIGLQYPEAEWAKIEKGETSGFSLGWYGTKRDLTEADEPKVSSVILIDARTPKEK